MLITLTNIKSGANAETNLDGPFDSQNHQKPLTVIMNIDPKKIINDKDNEATNKFNIYKTAAHEFYHAIQYSYTKSTFDNWINESDEVKAIMDEGSAVCFSDIFDRVQDGKLDKSKVAQYCKPLFFYDGMPDNPFPYFIDVCENVEEGKSYIRYASSLFSYYIYQRFGISAFNTIFGNIMTQKSVWKGLTTTTFTSGGNNYTFLQVFHDFHVTNALLHRQKNVYDIENILRLDQSNPSSKPLKIADEKMINVGATDSCSKIEFKR